MMMCSLSWILLNEGRLKSYYEQELKLVIKEILFIKKRFRILELQNRVTKPSYAK